MPTDLIQFTIGLVFFVLWAYIGKIVFTERCREFRGYDTVSKDSFLSDASQPAASSIAGNVRIDGQHGANGKGKAASPKKSKHREHQETTPG